MNDLRGILISWIGNGIAFIMTMIEGVSIIEIFQILSLTLTIIYTVCKLINMFKNKKGTKK